MRIDRKVADLRGSMGFLLSVGARATVMFLLEMFCFFLFKVTKSHQKAMSEFRTIVFCSKYHQYEFHY